MASRKEIEAAVRSARTALEEAGLSCDVTAGDLSRWFEADTQYPDITLDEVLRNPWLVIHEIVEIDAVKRGGLVLTKDVIIEHPEEVDRAHCEAATIEMEFAAKKRDAAHLRDRIPDVLKWSKDASVKPEMKTKYARLHRDAVRALRKIENEELK